jgi:hypothetical protein
MSGGVEFGRLGARTTICEDAMMLTGKSVALLPRILKVAELRAHGKRPDEIKGIIADAVAKGDLQTPGDPEWITCCRRRKWCRTPRAA